VIPDDPGRRGHLQDAAPEVAGGNEEAGETGPRPHDGQPIFGRRPEARPRAEKAETADTGRRRVKLLMSRARLSIVTSRSTTFLDRGAEEALAGQPRDQVCVVTKDHAPHETILLSKASDLPLDGPDSKSPGMPSIVLLHAPAVTTTTAVR
jgi:hypothetical protein